MPPMYIAPMSATEDPSPELSEFGRSVAIVKAEGTMADRAIFTLEGEQWGRLAEILKRPSHVPADPLHLMLLMKDLREYLARP